MHGDGVGAGPAVAYPPSIRPKLGGWPSERGQGGVGLLGGGRGYLRRLNMSDSPYNKICEIIILGQGWGWGSGKG